jgi:NDP-sugar pyrophosphorylase family protein
MKVILICPSERHELEQLTGTRALAALPLFGESVLDLWLAHLSAKGVKQVKILAADRYDQIKRLVGSGEKWGIEALVCSEAIEPTISEARKKHKPTDGGDFAPIPEDVQVVDHLPWDDSYPMFGNYTSWYDSCRHLLHRIQPGFRVGMRQLKPGVWVGRESQIAPSAKIVGPCWIGRGVHIGANATIGPDVIIEDESFVDETAEIVEAWVGPQTFVGALTQVKESLAWGHTLINWRSGSFITVPDPFLLSSVEQARTAVKSVLSAPRRFSARVTEAFARPFASLTGLKAKLPG